MADVTLVQSASNNGTVTPATTSSITATAGNLLVAVYTLLGTSPTISTPTGGGTWQLAENVAGSTVTTAMFYLPNNAGGGVNASAALGGTVTGWVACILEFSQTGANCARQFSRQASSTSTAVSDVFAPQKVQTIPSLLFVYAIGRATNVFTPAFTGLGPSGTSGWSASIQPQVGIQGISQDVYWGSNLAQGVGPWPTAPGTLATSATWKAIGAWFNTTATQPSQGTPVGGAIGTYQGSYQGTIGG
jgi:hypothetical protein